MKVFAYALLAVGTLATTAWAGSKLVVETVVTDLDVQGKDIVVGRFHLLTESGKPVLLPVGQQRYSVTPTLCADGSVDLAHTMSHSNGTGKDRPLGPYQQNAPLGESRDISFGSVTYSTVIVKAP